MVFVWHSGHCTHTDGLPGASLLIFQQFDWLMVCPPSFKSSIKGAGATALRIFIVMLVRGFLLQVSGFATENTKMFCFSPNVGI